MMTVPEWSEFLHELSLVILEGDSRQKLEHRRFPPEIHSLGDLGTGYMGATEAQIIAVEQHLGEQLPLSYRNFLQASNGWPPLSWAAHPGELWPVENIQWIRDHDPYEIAMWGEDVGGTEFDVSPEDHLIHRDDSCRYRESYVENLLASSNYGDACQLLLSPEVLDHQGEWECWKIASWYPGAGRWGSFEIWMLQNYEYFAERLKEGEE